MNTTTITGPGIDEPSNTLRFFEGSCSPTPDRPAVPEWCEKGVYSVHTRAITFDVNEHDTRYLQAENQPHAEASVRFINAGLAALRADRDYWRAEAEGWADAAAELEAQVANQIATIDALTRGGYTGKRRSPPDAAEGGGR